MQVQYLAWVMFALVQLLHLQIQLPEANGAVHLPMQLLMPRVLLQV